MNTLRISLACGNYDRTRALFDGRAPIEGCGSPPSPSNRKRRSTAPSAIASST